MGRAPALFLCLLAATLPCACRPPADPIGTTVRFDALGDRVAPTTPRRTTLALPPDFPDDVPLPARYAIDTMSEMPGTRLLSLLAEGEVAQLSRDTRRAMQQAGWQARLATQSGADTAVLAFEKDGRSALFAFDRTGPALAPDAAGVTVSVQLQDPMPAP